MVLYGKRKSLFMYLFIALVEHRCRSRNQIARLCVSADRVYIPDLEEVGLIIISVKQKLPIKLVFIE